MAALEATPFLDHRHPLVAEFAAATAGTGGPRHQAVRLYYAVRDGIRYDPYRLELSAEDFRSSTCLALGRGHCIPKSVLLAAAARAVGIPARLGFADVRNHLATRRLLDLMGTDVFHYHGYASLLIDGRWVKATPAFDIGLCDRFGVKPLDWDGCGDAVLHPFDAQGRLHMEYLRDHGEFDDLPYAEIVASMRSRYPRLLDAAAGDFAAEAAREAGSVA